MKRRVIKKNLLMRKQADRVPCHSILYDINPVDFSHHVRHATSWNDLGVRVPRVILRHPPFVVGTGKKARSSKHGSKTARLRTPREVLPRC
jgi:hypothetical protein